MTNIPLQQQIDDYIAQSSKHLDPEIIKQLTTPVQQLVQSNAVAQVLKEGEQVSAEALARALPNASGQMVTLAELLKHGPVVIIFYRGAWCPYCNLTLRAYQQALPQIQALGASLVAISPQTPDHSLTIQEKHELSFAVLSDVGNQVARQFGLVFRIDEALRSAHQSMGANLPAFNGNDSWELPMAGTFIIDQAGTVRLTFVDPNFTRRLDPSIVIARLTELSR